MNIYEIQQDYEESLLIKHLLRKQTFIKDDKINFKVYGFGKRLAKRSKSVFRNFALPYSKPNRFNNEDQNQSCECTECGGKVNKKITICQKSMNDSSKMKISRFPISPQPSIQPQQIRPSNRDLSLLGSSAHFSEKLQKQAVQRSARDSLVPVFQMIQAQNLMKKLSRTSKLEMECKQKMSDKTKDLFNRVQQSLKGKRNLLGDKDKMAKSQHIKNSPCAAQFRVKTDVSNYYFAKCQSKPQLQFTNNSTTKKNSLSTFDLKIPEKLARSEKFNQIQPLTQRVMCTYLRKCNSNSKLGNSKNK